MHISHSQQAEERFMEAFETYGDDVFRHCLAHSGDREEAVGLTQDIFLKAWEHVAAGHDVPDIERFLKTLASVLFEGANMPKASPFLTPILP